MTTFSTLVLNTCKRIPKGKVTTYKLLAESLGTKAYQSVGNALRANPFAPEVPCHRVVKNDLTIGGYKGQVQGEKIQQKLNLLQKEGVEVINMKVSRQHLFLDLD